MSDSTPLATGRRVLVLEAEAVRAAATALGDDFTRAVELLRGARGRVIVSGVGKSGLIARKIAATLTSTGTPATYLHPVDSLHGDLGIVGADDVAILLSKSGESDELFGLVGPLQRLAVPIVAITGARDSALGRAAALVLDARVSEEACPHDLAPTTSTTVALALGDALAVALLEAKGFARADFAALHPAGSLGRKLTLRVEDVMVPTTATVPMTATMRDAVTALAHHRGLVLVLEGASLRGVVTAGDLSRTAERDPNFLDLPVAAVMTSQPKTALGADLAAACVGVMERHGIMAMPVLDAHGTVVGVAHLHDLLRAGAV